ncbi:BQ5605_C024g09898 [Microbotryum silenes-dioicae]|uniref:BQ5605_C024g09898 protein n=1 Tax=Microbotryum silenes-dioicae TaxID=796604 RepID=A0A2X0MLW5_9BASI|nr:BQ5605_C024g09898 [Microbotryum silenes-dioicae]
MMNMVVTLQKMNNNSLPWLPKSKLAEPIYAQLNNARWLSARRMLGSRLTNEETGQSRRFTFAIRDNVPRAYLSLAYPSGSSSTLLQSSSRASTTRHPAPATPLPDPAFSRSTSSDARTTRSSPVHANDCNGGGGLLTPAARSARGRLSGAQLGLKKSATHAPSPSPAEAMQLMPTSKEESRKGKGVQRFETQVLICRDDDDKASEDDSPSSGLSESNAERRQVQDILAGKQRIQEMILSSDPKRDQRRKRYLRHRTLVRSDSQGR